MYLLNHPPTQTRARHIVCDGTSRHARKRQSLFSSPGDGLHFASGPHCPLHHLIDDKMFCQMAALDDISALLIWTTSLKSCETSEVSIGRAATLKASAKAQEINQHANIAPWHSDCPIYLQHAKLYSDVERKQSMITFSHYSNINARMDIEGIRTSFIACSLYDTQISKR